MRVDDGVLVVLDADEEPVKERGNTESNDGDHDNGNAQPEQESVLLPLPELAGERDGAGAGGVNQRFERKGHRRGMEDYVAESDEGDQEQEFKRVDEVVGQLRGGDIEPQQECCGEAEDGSAAENRVDTDEEPDGDAPGQLLRGRSHAEECEDGKCDTAISPVVMEGRPVWLGAVRIRFARVHWLTG